MDPHFSAGVPSPVHGVRKRGEEAGFLVDEIDFERVGLGLTFHVRRRQAGQPWFASNDSVRVVGEIDDAAAVGERVRHADVLTAI